MSDQARLQIDQVIHLLPERQRPAAGPKAQEAAHLADGRLVGVLNLLAQAQLEDQRLAEQARQALDQIGTIWLGVLRKAEADAAAAARKKRRKGKQRR